MAGPTRDEIETYMSITGASESLALQKLEEYGGNLNEAVNAHFSGGDVHITNPPPAAFPQHNFVDTNNETRFGHGLFPMLSAIRSFRPSLLLDPNYRRDLFNRIGSTGFTGRAPLFSQPGAVTGVPVEFNSSYEQIHHSGPGHNNGDEDIPTEYNRLQIDNDVEDQMIQSAIRTSRQEAEVQESSGAGLSERQLYQEDDDLAHALSLSLKTAEQEKAVREQQVKDYNQELGINGGWKPGSSSNQNRAQNVEEQLLKQKSNSSAGFHPQHSEDMSHFKELGGISSKELGEAVMLETALFGELSKGASNRSLNAAQVQSHPEKSVVPNQQPIHHSLSPSLQASRLLKEQQDMEYLASLLHDKEKEGASHIKMLNDVECERKLAAKKPSLPCEPTSDDEDAVTLLVRMPNGSRLGRRFLKSDKLQFLFDFIDIDGAVKPRTYRVVRAYPRRAFNIEESLITLSELGLTNKKEVLFLELI